MNQNPYAAPKSAVADVEEGAMRRPPQVTIAVALMVLTYLVGTYFLVEGWEDLEAMAPFAAPIIIAISAALAILIVVKVFQGRNWARIVYLVLFCIGIPGFVDNLPALFAELPVLASISVAQGLGQLAALVLVFTPPGRNWFRRNREIAMRRVFSYGSLQRAEVQRATFGRTLASRADDLAGFERTVSRGPGGHANLVRNANATSRVGGYVLELTDAELAKADEYERKDGYERIEVTLASGTTAWMYVEADVERTA